MKFSQRLFRCRLHTAALVYVLAARIRSSSMRKSLISSSRAFTARSKSNMRRARYLHKPWARKMTVSRAMRDRCRLRRPPQPSTSTARQTRHDKTRGTHTTRTEGAGTHLRSSCWRLMHSADSASCRRWSSTNASAALRRSGREVAAPPRLTTLPGPPVPSRTPPLLMPPKGRSVDRERTRVRETDLEPNREP